MTDPFAIFDDAPLQTARDETKLDRLQVANGGTGELVHVCTNCKGRGNFVSYTGRIVGRCFKCKGAGKVSGRVVAAAKAADTKKRNDAEWLHAYHAEIAYMGHRAMRSSFFASLEAQFKAKGRLSEGQLEVIRKDMAGEADRQAAFKAKREAETASKSGEVDLSAINALFETAKGNGLKKPKFRADGFAISEAPAHGRNAGALYVTAGELYLGKLEGGKFIARREAPEDTLTKLQAIAKDPLAVGVAYGKLTGKCCCCGRELTDPVSVENGIGPICQDKWGM